MSPYSLAELEVLVEHCAEGEGGRLFFFNLLVGEGIYRRERKRAYFEVDIGYGRGGIGIVKCGDDGARVLELEADPAGEALGVFDAEHKCEEREVV